MWGGVCYAAGFAAHAGRQDMYMFVVSCKAGSLHAIRVHFLFGSGVARFCCSGSCVFLDVRLSLPVVAASAGSTSYPECNPQVEAQIRLIHTPLQSLGHLCVSALKTLYTNTPWLSGAVGNLRVSVCNRKMV